MGMNETNQVVGASPWCEVYDPAPHIQVEKITSDEAAALWDSFIRHEPWSLEYREGSAKLSALDEALEDYATVTDNQWKLYKKLVQWEGYDNGTTMWENGNRLHCKYRVAASSDKQDEDLRRAAAELVKKTLIAKEAKAVEEGKPFKDPLPEEFDLMVAKELVKLQARAKKDREKEQQKLAADAAKADEEAARIRKQNNEDWAHNWYYLRNTNKIVQLGELKQYSKDGFNAIYAAKTGSSKTFDQIRDGNGFLEAADVSYAAGFPPVFEFAGETFVNKFRADSAPVAAAEYTHEGWAAVLTVLHHLELLLGDKKGSVEMVKAWIALNVKHPGKLIGTALLVKGVEGDGKTIIFHDMMAAIMGKENVADVSKQEIKSDFTSWARGRALRVLEEIKAPGVNRHELLENVKALITNKVVSTVGKGADGYASHNTTNYVGLTNHGDSLPINKNDRRWWVLSTNCKHKEDLEKVYGNKKRHFDRLGAAIEGHSDALRKYFLDLEPHPAVYHNMAAPDTDARDEMIAAEDDALGASYLDAYCGVPKGEEPTWGVSLKVIAGGALSFHLKKDMGEYAAPKGRQLLRLVTGRGYYQYPKMVKWKGHPYTVYVKDRGLARYNDDNNKKIR
jgi:hypothetical protein